MDETIVNAQEFSLLAFLSELIRSVKFLIPFFLPVSVTVWSTFPDVVVVNRKEVKNYFLISVVSSGNKCPHVQ